MSDPVESLTRFREIILPFGNDAARLPLRHKIHEKKGGRVNFLSLLGICMCVGVKERHSIRGKEEIVKKHRLS